MNTNTVFVYEIPKNELMAFVEPHMQALAETSAEWRRLHGEPDG